MGGWRSWVRSELQPRRHDLGWLGQLSQGRFLSSEERALSRRRNGFLPSIALSRTTAKGQTVFVHLGTVQPDNR